MITLVRSLEEEDFLLKPEHAEYKDYAVVKSEHDASEEEGYRLPVWIAMLGVFVISFAIAGCVFYLSYKHEKLCGKHANKDDEEVQGDEDVVMQVEQGLYSRVAMKKFGDHNSITHSFNTASSMGTEDSFSVESGDDIQTSIHSRRMLESIRTTSTSSSPKNYAQLVTQPRCVLCSVPYLEGEDVAHSNNPSCHHEYHKACLIKHWDKCNRNERKCPVCREAFIFED